MDYKISSHQAEGYTINTEVFTGPLDLLLQLIERAELDITRLALAQVTDQYLEYMHAMPQENAAEVSAFLVIAARLVQIKSSALLPRPVVNDSIQEEDPGDALARQLLLYKRFKDLSRFLEEREEQGLRTYLRLDTSPRVQIPTKLDLSELTLEALIDAAEEIFGGGNLPPLSEVVSIPRITIREKIDAILTQLKTGSSATFKSVLQDVHSRLEMVVTFLALLELIKQHIVAANQNALFGEIEFHSEGEGASLDAKEMEFGE